MKTNYDNVKWMMKWIFGPRVFGQNVTCFSVKICLFIHWNAIKKTIVSLSFGWMENINIVIKKWDNLICCVDFGIAERRCCL